MSNAEQITFSYANNLRSFREYTGNQIEIIDKKVKSKKYFTMINHITQTLNASSNKAAIFYKAHIHTDRRESL